MPSSPPRRGEDQRAQLYPQGPERAAGREGRAPPEDFTVCVAWMPGLEKGPKLSLPEGWPSIHSRAKWQSRGAKILPEE